ncbi:MAG TPA: hypothetical protein VE077_00920 [Candidatus Methylomirabilis sp.]|nr:hypothetical protein [Candidatus Methylomirabilis sp.]
MKISAKHLLGFASRPTEIFAVLMSCLILFASGALAQTGAKLQRPAAKTQAAAKPGNPCCQVTGINSTTGVVTAKVNSSGQTFQFTINDAALLKSLRVGQGVYANFKTNQLSLDGKSAAGTIISIGPVDGAKPIGPVDGVRPIGPVDGAKPIGPVDGVHPIGPVDGAKSSVEPATQIARATANPAESCCGITSINSATGVVTARVNSTGQTFQFTISNEARLKSLVVGQGIFANLKTSQVSLDGKTPAGTIIGIGPVDGGKPIGPIDGAKPIGPVDGAKPIGPIDGAKPVGPIDGAKPIGPVDAIKSSAAPAAEVVRVDSATGVVIGREKATGRQFMFHIVDPSAAKSLTPGEGVYVNYNSREVSLDGKTPAGPILMIGRAMNVPGATQTPGSQQNADDLMLDGQAATASLQSDTLACSTKPSHMGKPVAQNVMVPSGATIYCRFQLPSRGLMPPDRQVALSYSPPGAVQYPPQSAHFTSPSASLQGRNQGPYADFQINTKAIPQTVPLTVSGSFSNQTASTTVTLVRAAILVFGCDPYYTTHTTACDVPVVAGQVEGWYSNLFVFLTAPADPDGMSLSLTTSYGYSGQVSVIGGRSVAVVSFPGQPVGKETPFSVSIVDPLDGSTHTINGLLEPPVVYTVQFGTYGITSISSVPLDGEQVQVSLGYMGDTPADGTPLQIQYGGTPNLISGPSTVPFAQNNYGWGSMTFSVTVLPCGVPPCQVTVTAGNSALTSKTATLTVNP